MNWFKGNNKGEATMKTEAAKTEVVVAAAVVTEGAVNSADPTAALKVLAKKDVTYKEARAAADTLLQHIEEKILEVASRDVHGHHEREKEIARTYWKAGGGGIHTAHSCEGCGGTRICMLGHADLLSAATVSVE